MRDNQRGATFTVAGILYALTYDFNKLCDLEQVGLDLLSGAMAADKLKSPLFVRQLFFDGCTVDGQALPDLDAAGELIGALGYNQAITLISDALSSTVSALATGTDAGQGDPENPATAQPSS